MNTTDSNVIAFDNPHNKILTIKVSLVGAKPPIWRRIEVPAVYSLGDLHFVIQIAMGWENSHLHAFRVGKRTFSIPMDDDEFESEDEDADAVTLESLGLAEAGARAMYEYDFGDGWVHELKVERETKRSKTRRYPQCIKAVGACPPEDCGGIHRFSELLEILKNPEHAEHEEMSEWLGGEFDPKFVDLDEINAILAEGFAA